MTDQEIARRVSSEGCSLLQKRFGHNIFWSGFIGFLLGILFSFTIWAGNRVIQTKAELGDESNPITSLANPFNLSLSSPADAATVTDGTLSIAGATSASATVVITGGAGDIAVDSNGQFATSYPLIEGENELTISAISSDGRQSTVTRNVFYTQETL